MFGAALFAGVEFAGEAAAQKVGLARARGDMMPWEIAALLRHPIEPPPDKQVHKYTEVVTIEAAFGTQARFVPLPPKRWRAKDESQAAFAVSGQAVFHSRLAAIRASEEALLLSDFDFMEME